MAQLVTRIPDALAADIDALVDDGTFASRSEAVRRGLEVLIDRIRRDRIGAEIVEGYRRIPQTDEEMIWSEQAMRDMIASDPW